MTKRMLIDATHAEETRVVVLDGSHIEDYDVESATKKQLKGNIYLAKVVRVEPSLQAAFVEYGGNRHGFLAFDEIHPDYYQIPIADREKLLALQEAEEQAAAAAEDAEASRQAQRLQAGPLPAERRVASEAADEEETSAADAAPDSTADEPAPAEPWANDQLENDRPEDVAVADAAGPTEGAPDAGTETGAEAGLEARAGEPDATSADGDAETSAEEMPETPPETLGGDQDGTEDLRSARAARHFLRQYKIQEVIHRRQIVLVQVVKEERGLKGAALTTYISLAGRYGVLMPNSPRGGGVSRKITAPGDRKRLKEIIAELGIPAGMGLIVRTAGASRPKAEIKRDCEYLLRLWDEIRDTVMKSVAPALVYEEASLIKRAIRDVYSRDIEEVLVDGEAAWQSAHEFMRMLMPSHAEKVILWRNGGHSLFSHERVEAELDATLSPTVPLRSGGSLVINQAEALVAIDVNSGRSTRERNIEETALRTNLEAAAEVARQLRLRDLAGLIVIDFIDMEVRKHNAMVERRLKEALKGDRARVQVGRISHFGLLEMSRQRLHSSLDETSFLTCPHCGGTGHVRSVESSAVHLLRAIEDDAARKGAGELVAHASKEVALYILNHKRAWLGEIEARDGVAVSFAVEEGKPDAETAIERLRTHAAKPATVEPVGSAPATAPRAIASATVPDLGAPEEGDGASAAPAESPRDAGVVEGVREGAAEGIPDEAPEDREQDRERHHRRRRRRRRREGGEDIAASAAPEAPVPPSAPAAPLPPELAEQPDIVEASLFAASEEAPATAETRREPRRRPPRRGHDGEARRGPREGEPRRRHAPRSAPAESRAIALPLGPLDAPPPVPSAEVSEARAPEQPPAAPIAPAAPAPDQPAETPPMAREPAAPVAAAVLEVVEATKTPEPEAVAPAPTPDGERPPVDDRPPAPAIQPVLVGDEEERPVPKKRGWWRS